MELCAIVVLLLAEEKGRSFTPETACSLMSSTGVLVCLARDSRRG